MFTYLRYFSAISLLLVLIAALGVGMYFKSIAADDLRDIVEKNNAALAQGFINTVWKRHLPTLQQLATVEPDIAQWKRYREFVDFSNDVYRYFESTPATKVSLYTKGGSFMLAATQTQVTLGEEHGSSWRGLFGLPEPKKTLQEYLTRAQQGQIVSRIMTGNAIVSADGTPSRSALVQTFIPILSDKYVPVVAGSQMQIDGIAEVLYDITPQWDQLFKFQVVGTGGIILIFLVLFSALIVLSHKAEAIIARQHEANLELTAAAAAAEAQSRDKSEFLANISHELRTPLNSIIGFSEIIKNEVLGSIENQQYHDYVRDIHASGVHLLSLINDILDYSKAEAGKLELDIAEVDATKTIRNCMRLVAPRAESGQVLLVEELPEEHVVMHTDAKKLKQILLNLLSNAVKFTPANGEVKVTAWKNLLDQMLTIEVKDTGIGIAPKDIARAMAPFGQVDGALNRKYEGTGLGLPLTRKLVEVMGGAFSITSEPGKGTVVTFSLPMEGKAKRKAA